MGIKVIRYLSIALICFAPIAAVAGNSEAPATHAPSPEVMKLLEQGSRYYPRHQFKEAIGPYAKALELEKKQATLPTNLMRVLIDNLGMAYGVTGDFSSAKATFEYGLSKDDTYPMFYYNLACTYAELNELDGCLVNLELAFKYRDNMIPGERFPDPTGDSSFQRYLKNGRFIEVLRKYSAAH